MRKRDPLGKLKTDPEDSRLMLPVKPGEKGEWTLLGAEGIDNEFYVVIPAINGE